MIKTLSPHYINIPLVSPLTSLTCSRFRLELFVWKGTKIAAPSQANYVITKENPEALTSDTKINISNLISSFIDFEPIKVLTNSLVNSPNQVWVKTVIYYTTTNETEETIGQSEIISIAIKGYGYGIEGENPTLPTDKILMQGREFKVARDSKVIIPIQLDETPAPTPSIVVTNVTETSTGVFDYSFIKVGNYTSFNIALLTSSQAFLYQTIDTITSPQTIDTGSSESFISFYLSGYDNSSEQTVTSNIYTI